MRCEMELGTQIKKYRTEMGLNQEELAERIFVTRQSVSNWENGKTYPDISSLLRLSEVFQVSLDQLIKGDLETMKQQIDPAAVAKFKRYSVLFNIIFAAMILSVIPLILWPSWWLLSVLSLFYAFGFWFSLKVERLKKENNIRTYKEIVAFTEGKRLDEIETAREDGKWPYQRVLLAIGSGLLVVAVAAVTICLIRWMR